ncbi:glycosyltransferase [Halalkalibaculum sp. DA3122]|uniref:glycosyltransferase n=1 Tax=Halalkalibaculum sp. DA3122 TaxID=3373607 RepID=UPI003754542B
MKQNIPRLLIVGYVWPEPNSSAAGHRMMQLISIFKEHGWKITFASSATESEHAADLQERGIDTQPVEINSSGFDTFLENLQPDVVMFDRFVVEEQFGWRVAEHCPGALRILDTEDLHCLRRARRRAILENRPFSEVDLLEDEVAKREIASILRCDLSLIISEYEMKLLTDHFQVDESLLHYLPFLLNPIDQAQVEEWPTFDDRAHYITMGNFRHPPNRDAVQFLKTEVWPRIRSRQKKAVLHVYGAYPSRQVTDLHEPREGFHIKGRTPDARAVVRSAKVCLAPLRFGAGLKGKLVEAMQCGTPSVTTPVGAEGLNGEKEWPGAVAQSSEEIAAAAVRLYTNRSAWEKAQVTGLEIVNTRFGKSRFEPAFTDRIQHVRENLGKHRRHNFTGSMLMHHTMASTRYMSKWIEAKNRM